MHLPYLSTFARYFKISVVLPISKREVGTIDVNQYATLSIPSIRDAPIEQRRLLVLSLIERYVPVLRDEGELVNRQSARDELSQILLDSDPDSRSQIEDALEFYARTFDEDKHGVGLREPVASLDKQSLSNHFRASLKRLLELKDPFEKDTGFRLLEETHQLPDPFDSNDPMFWFIGCISVFSCLFFDAGKRTGLPVVLKYRFDRLTNSLISGEIEDFTADLRFLRTVFQHNLKPDDKDDRKIIAAATEWFESNVGRGCGFDRHTARAATGYLLRTVDETVRRIADVVTNLSKAKGAMRNEIMKDLDRTSRSMADHEVEAAVRRVVKDHDINVEPDDVLRKFQAKIVAEVRATSCRIENLDEELIRICEMYCYTFARTPPSIGHMLKELGVPQRQMANVMKELNEAWENDATMTRDKYIELARSRAGSV
jgi:hypothetical protein